MRKELFWSTLFILSFLAANNALASPGGQAAAPDFSLRNIRTNTQTNLSSYRGQVVLIDFFATWCQPCAITIPILREVNAAYGSAFQLISIDVQWNGGEDDTTVLNFIEDREMSWTVLKDTANSATGTAYAVTGIPTFFLIDKTGDVRQSHQGASISVDLLKSEISVLLQEEQAPPANNGNPQNAPQSSEEVKSSEEDSSEDIPTGLVFGGLVVAFLGVVGLGVFVFQRPGEGSSPKELGTLMETQFSKERTALAEILTKLEKAPRREKTKSAENVKRKARRRRR
ncbi:MAG: TlpA family protein disulfide reductase [Candidatus Heimdallarchaeota archaeon]